MPLLALSLGSNLGDRCATLTSARDLLVARLQAPLLARSCVYETEPVDAPPQPWFLNQVVTLETDLEPEAVLDLCLCVEASLGRTREVPKGPRTLDVDLLFYGGLLLDAPRLILPHPALPTRRCILAPLAEVAPTWRHPASGKSVRELLSECHDASAVQPLGEWESELAGG